MNNISQGSLVRLINFYDEGLQSKYYSSSTAVGLVLEVWISDDFEEYANVLWQDPGCFFLDNQVMWYPLPYLRVIED